MTNQESQQQFMAQAEPQEQHRWLRRLVGEWMYEMKASMVPGIPEETMRGAATVRPFGGLWVMVEDRGDATQSAPRASIITLGYDPQKGRFTGTFVDSESTFLWVYDGWLDGDTLTLESQGPEMSGSGMATYRDVVEIVDEGHWVLHGLAPAENGQWNEFMTTHYRRA